jgi:hypothetical protein
MLDSIPVHIFAPRHKLQYQFVTLDYHLDHLFGQFLNSFFKPGDPVIFDSSRFAAGETKTILGLYFVYLISAVFAFSHFFAPSPRIAGAALVL